MIDDRSRSAFGGPPRRPPPGVIPNRAVVLYGMHGLSFVRSMDERDGYTLLTAGEGTPMAPMADPELAQAAIDRLIRSGVMTRWVDVRWLDSPPDWFTDARSTAESIETVSVLAVPSGLRTDGVRSVMPYRRRRMRRACDRFA